MKYKNVTKNVLQFRAFDLKGVKRVFTLKPNQEVELGKEAHLGGLELVDDGEIKKRKKGD
jgi:hypothetical protein